MQILRTTAPVVTVETAEAEATVSFYEQLFGQPVRARLRNPAGTLDLVLVGSMLVIAGDSEALAARRDLQATFVVDSLDEWRVEMDRIGATVVEEPTPGPYSAAGPIGRFMFVRHPDGHLFEYFQPNS
jgi:catechol 2,3-dioxygenase-like lactoylglutathione lyase family enzyme